MLALGIYLTTAVKCGKTGYTVPTRTVRACSLLLEAEPAKSKRLMSAEDIAATLALVGEPAARP